MFGLRSQDKVGTKEDMFSEEISVLQKEAKYLALRQ
jgi:hypothetical protein